MSSHRASAARALLRRKAIRGSLTEWCRHCGFEPALHHQLIIQELEALERGEFDRLAVSAPPGSAKTTYVSHLFAPWYLARNPDKLVLSGSHTQEFAERKIGRKVRNLIEAHGRVLGLELDPSSKSMADWALTTGGGYRAVGVGVAVAGERADLGLIEDPFARWEDAQRLLVQEEAWEWYEGDFVPRLKPGAKRILIMTRFHELDLLGRVQERDEALGFKWRHIRLPMIAEDDDPIGRQPGERLWPEWFTEEQVLEARSNPHKWIALYQQRPSPESGDYFKAEWLKPYTTLPDLKTLRIYGGSDYAVTADGGDYTVHVVVGLDPEGKMYLLDLWRQRASSDEWVEILLRSREGVEADGMGCRIGTDQGRRWTVPAAQAARARGIRFPRDLPDPRRQVHSCAIDQRAHGAGRAARSDQQAMVCRPSGGAVGIPCRQARRPS